MLSHIVIFWLKPELTKDQIIEFQAGLESLKGIDSAKEVYIGTPAPTKQRPVIDSTYSVGLTVLFDSIEGHDAYQVHPLHQGFLGKYASFWSRVVIYDYI